MFINFTGVMQGANQPPNYPSSSKKVRNWDKVVKEAEKIEQEEEKTLEGDAALNNAFQKIYGSASDDVKRAMMKSFVSVTFLLNFNAFVTFYS